MRFEEMEVWQKAKHLAVAVYADFAGIKDFAFKDQICRAAISVSNNIAEGAERGTQADFARFLDIAKGSAGEVRSMYFLAEELMHIEKRTANIRRQQCDLISKQLAGFARYLRQRS